MNLQEIKATAEKKLDLINKQAGLFWAFSQKQFDENKTPLQEGEKYISIGAGGYLPKSKLNFFIAETDKVIAWEKAEIKKNKLEYKHIAHELANHEVYYTGDLSAVDFLPYPAEQIKAVYLKELKKQNL